MILRFPSSEVLQLAITSETVAAEVTASAVSAARDDDRAVWLETSATIGRTSMAELKRFGVERKRRTPIELEPIQCWHQAISPVPIEQAVEDDTEVLIRIDRQETFAEIVTEMMRLGNDRQSFASIDHGSHEVSLLRVIGPPYYTLLRAIESSDGPLAFWTPHPRVWVEYGFDHPLSTKLNPPGGKWLLIQANGHWQFIDEPVMTDVYQIVDFDVGQETESLTTQRDPPRFRVPVRFTDASTTESAELWVLQQDSMSQIESLIRRSDDGLISRLAFAVASGTAGDSDPTVVLRVRPSTLPPPVLVIDALACVSYLRIPNLFLPVGRRLHPPLRRDVVVELLSSSSEQIHWLSPREPNSFVPQSIDDAAFRPLSDWVDYVMDHHAEPLQAWIKSHQFDFEHFVCADDQKKKPPPRQRPKPEEPVLDDAPPSRPPGVAEKKVTRRKKSKNTERFATSAAVPKPDQWQIKLRELETEYRDSTEPLDSPVRSTLWAQMGMVHSMLNHPHDTSICFSNAAWHDPERLLEHGTEWMQAEMRCAGLGGSGIEGIDGAELERRLKGDRGGYSQAGLMVSQLVFAGAGGDGAEVVAANQSAIVDYLMREESRLPIRAAWMGWVALSQIAGQDVLMLARARDRLLERLFRTGLAPEFDMPAFMRSGAVNQSERLTLLRDQMVDLHTDVERWVVEPEISQNPQTKRYVDLVFAFAMARLGETSTCHQWMSDAERVLDQKDPVHRWVWHAYGERIKQALSGLPLEGSLSAQRMEELQSFDRGQKYVLDRLLQRSQILEPHLDVNPFENFLHRYTDDLSRELSQLQRVVDPVELSRQLDRLFEVHDDADDHIRILPDALQLAPRLGETQAAKLLDRVWEAIDHCELAFQKAALLHRAVLIAAHYGRTELVHSLVDVMVDSLPNLVDEYLSLAPSERQQAGAIEALISQSFRGMRRLGMRNEIGRLYERVSECLQSADIDDDETKPEAIKAQRLLLSVAGGSYYFGQLDAARAIADTALERLQSRAKLDLPTTRLLCGYLEAIAAAPIEESLSRVRDLFAFDSEGTEVQGRPRIANSASSMTTDSHFSICHLDVVEAAVMSLIGDDFSLSDETRRWLDEEEYLVRRRIHAQMQAAVG